MVQIQRAYDKPTKQDGYRVLVDRLWPRGKTKKELALDAWFKEVSPSTELRKAFDHDPEKWLWFQKNYKKELKESVQAQEKLKVLEKIAGRQNLTLVFGSKETKYTHAVLLQELLEKRLQKSPSQQSKKRS